MKIKYNKPTLAKLEQLFKSLDYTIRYEKGQFKSGYCIIYQKKIIVINKFFDVKGRIESLIDILNEISFSMEEIPEAIREFASDLAPVAKQQELDLSPSAQ